METSESEPSDSSTLSSSCDEDLDGVSSTCVLEILIQRCTPRNKLLLEAHKELDYVIFRGTQWSNVTWTTIHAFLKLIFVQGACKSIWKELRHDRNILAIKTCYDSIVRLICRLDAIFSKSTTSSLSAMLPGPQKHALHSSQQLWRKHFRYRTTQDFPFLLQEFPSEASSKNHPTLLGEAATSFEASILSSSRTRGRWSVCLCASSKSCSNAEIQTFAFLVDLACKRFAFIEMTLCCESFQEWRCSAEIIMQIWKRGTYGICVQKHKDTAAEALVGLAPPSVLQFQSSRGELDESHATRLQKLQLHLPSFEGIACIGSIPSVLLRDVLSKAMSRGHTPAAAERMPTLLALTAHTLKKIGIPNQVQSESISSHLQARVRGLYRCVACKHLVMPNICSEDSAPFEEQVVRAGFDTSVRQRRNVSRTIYRGDPWLPPMCEAVYRLGNTNQFHRTGRSCKSSSCDDEPHDDSIQHLDFLFIGGGKASQDSEADDSWQFCAACAAVHLRIYEQSPEGNIEYQPNQCQCHVCDFERKVQGHEVSTDYWRQIRDPAKFWPKKREDAGAFSVNNSPVILACPFCSTTKNHI